MTSPKEWVLPIRLPDGPVSDVEIAPTIRLGEFRKDLRFRFEKSDSFSSRLSKCDQNQLSAFTHCLRGTLDEGDEKQEGVLIGDVLLMMQLCNLDVQPFLLKATVGGGPGESALVREQFIKPEGRQWSCWSDAAQEVPRIAKSVAELFGPRTINTDKWARLRTALNLYRESYHVSNWAYGFILLYTGLHGLISAAGNGQFDKNRLADILNRDGTLLDAKELSEIKKTRDHLVHKLEDYRAPDQQKAGDEQAHVQVYDKLLTYCNRAYSNILLDSRLWDEFD